MADLLGWAERAGGGQVVELVCAHAAEPVVAASERSVVVRLTRCFAETPLALPLELLARGVAVVVLRADTCARPAAFERLGLWDRLRRACRIDGLRVGAGPDTRAPATILSADAMPVFSRRGLLGLVTGATGAPVVPPEGTDHQRLRAAVRALVLEAAAPLPAARAAVLTSAATPSPEEPVRALVAEASAASPRLAEQPPASAGVGSVVAEVSTAGRGGTAGGVVPDLPGVGLMLAASDCIAAGVCVRSCPEGALVLTEVGGVATLALDAGACSGCRACVAACPTKALVVEGKAGWRALLDDVPRVVAEVAVRTCRRCGASFRAGRSRELCPPCAFRREHPFGSVPPDQLGDGATAGRVWW